MLAVSRYKHPPVWMTAPDLFNAMNSTDTANAIGAGDVYLREGGKRGNSWRYWAPPVIGRLAHSRDIRSTEVNEVYEMITLYQFAPALGDPKSKPGLRQR
jgi:hypothetical protein